MNRRDFIRAIAGTAALASFPKLVPAETTATVDTATTSAKPAGTGKARHASDIVKLGPAQIAVRQLGLGTGTNGWNGSSNQTRQLGLQGLARMLQVAHEKGLTFWDAADMYGTHIYIREALKSVPRDEVTILTKSRAKTAEEMRKDIERFLKELGTDHIDILLLHCVTDANWTTTYRGAMDAVLEAQQKGLIRSRGLSCHSLDALKLAAREPWVEIDLARINPAGVQMDAKTDVVLPILREMKAAGKGVIGMKVLGCGKLCDKIDEMLKFQLSLDCVDCFTIGLESIEQMVDIINRIERVGKPA